MRRGIVLAVALFGGTLIGSAFQGVLRDALAPRALAQSAPHQYKVVDASFRAEGYEEDLNKYTAEGWRYVGSIPASGRSSSGGYLVFEKP